MQVPLSYLSAGFAFLTAFVSWLIDSKTKADIYMTTSYIMNLPNEILHNRMSVDFVFTRDFTYEHFTHKDRENQRSAIDWAVFNLFIFWSLLLNFLYSSLL